MAKKIKFNLRCDGNPIRTIEDLQNNFLIEDILSYYENHLLQKWLDVRGYTTYLEEVNAITSEDNLEIAKSLAEIFEIEEDPKNIEEDLCILKYKKEKEESNSLYKSIEEAQKNAVNDFFAEYEELRANILKFENKFSTIVLKSNIDRIAENYFELFSMQYIEIFWELYKQESYIAIFCMIMNPKIRSLYISKKKSTSINGDNQTSPIEKNKAQIKETLYSLIGTVDTIENKCCGLLKSFVMPNTNGNWRTSEKFSREKEYMIIRAPENGAISKVVNTSEDAEPFNDKSEEKFKIIKGIQYQSNYVTDKFYYMEV